MIKRFNLTFPTHLIRQPLVHRMSKETGVAFKICAAKVVGSAGKLDLELEGDEAALRRAVDWFRAKEVAVGEP